MSRCLVNVANGRYLNGQSRLLREVERFDPSCAKFVWTNDVPVGCPQHKDKPYAFKAYALQVAADSGHDLLLWADASVLPLRSLESLWERIERDGYWIARNGWTNYEWTADSAYSDLFPGIPLDEAREENKKFPQVVATAFGLNLRTEIGRKFLEEYLRLAKTDAFIGPWANTNCPREKRFDYGANSPYTMGPCGPPDVLGHRHDQTAASLLAWRLGMKLTDCPEVFSYPPGHEGHEKTILLAAGA